MSNLEEKPEFPLVNIPKLRSEIKEAAYNGTLILFIGAGVSKIASEELPSWSEFADKVLKKLRDKYETINYLVHEQLKKLDPKKQLSIAEQISKKNNKELFAEYFEKELIRTDIYDSLHKFGCGYVTTNFDDFLSKSYREKTDYSQNQSPPDKTKPNIKINRYYSRDDFKVENIKDNSSVIYLHGHVDHPETMIVTTEDYLDHYIDEKVNFFLKDLFIKRTVLFIGYGLEEIEILENILRKGKKVRGHYAIQSFFSNENDLFKLLREYYKDTYKINLIGYIKDLKGHNQLENILENWATEMEEIKNRPLFDDLNFMNEVLNGS